MSTLKVTTIQDTSGSNASTSEEINQGRAKAWVNFSLSAGTIRDDFNISSLDDNGTGFFSVNFSTAMANANYATISTGSNGTQAELNSGNYNRMAESTAHTTSKFSVACYAPDNTVLVDIGYCGVAVFGD